MSVQFQNILMHYCQKNKPCLKFNINVIKDLYSIKLSKGSVHIENVESVEFLRDFSCILTY